MGAVGELLERKDRPAYTRFERVAVEDKAASKREGKYVAVDVELALITPPYSKDVFKIKVPQWMDNMKQDVHNGRMPQAWMDDYLEAYRRWKAGLEIPLNGTAIKGWGVISPAQQETLLRMNILTVEDLAGINDEGVQRIGMGGMDLRNKATAWLAQLKDKGPLTQENAALKAENVVLRANVASLKEKVDYISAQIRAANTENTHARDAAYPVAQPAPAAIDASEILDDEPEAPGAKKEPTVRPAVPPKKVEAEL